METMTADDICLPQRAPLSWVRAQMTEVLQRWRYASTHLRGQRRRKTRQVLARWAAALLIAGGLAWQSLAPAIAYAPIFEDPRVIANLPLCSADVGTHSTPTFVDLDNDGDFDAFVGELDGNLNYYRNDGSPGVPSFTEVTGAANPLNGVDIGEYSTPAFVDVDDDNDLDVFIGGFDGTIAYYRNDGNVSVPSFTEVTGAANPLGNVADKFVSAPTFVDVDDDDDFDAFIGETYGNIIYYRNDGTAVAPDFTEVTGAANPFNAVDIVSLSKPTFADVDGDGDFDAFIGEIYGTIIYYRNDGSATVPAFTAITGAANPLDGVDVGPQSAPAFVDVDGDFDFDVFIGESDGHFIYYRNDGSASAPNYIAVFANITPFDGLDVGQYSKPAFVDIDDDSDFDVFSGETMGGIIYYRNDGNAAVPDFTEVSGSANPLDGVLAPSVAAPTFVDIDDDGDFDAFVGKSDGVLEYYRNEGTASAPDFAKVTGIDNPLSLVDVGFVSMPAFVDVDGDDDFDVFVGETYGTIAYYRNDGSASAPSFTGGGVANPLHVVDVAYESAPTFVDVDGDGDFDAFVGEYYGTIVYYRNDGSASMPNFTEVTGMANPFNGVDVEDYATPTFADLDADGDFDAVIGEEEGNLNYYRNYGIHNETQTVNGNFDVSFGYDVNRVAINANGLNLGDTEVYIEATAQATTVGGEAVAHRYTVTPTVTSGLDASITFFFGADEIPVGQICDTLNVYHWDGSAWDDAITPDSRQCVTEPYSLTVSGVSEFSPFVLRSGATAPTAVNVLHGAAQVPGLLLTAAGAVLASLTAWLGFRKKPRSAK